MGVEPRTSGMVKRGSDDRHVMARQGTTRQGTTPCDAFRHPTMPHDVVGCREARHGVVRHRAVSCLVVGHSTTSYDVVTMPRGALRLPTTSYDVVRRR